MTTVTLLVSIIVLSVVFYGYVRNLDSAIILAQQVLHRVGVSVVERTQNIFDTAFMTVDTYVNFPDIEKKASIHSHSMSPVFFKFLKYHPDFTSVYIGFDDGDFFLVSSLHRQEAMKKAQKIPASAVWYTQTIGHRADGLRYEFRKYLNAGFVIVGSSSKLDISYDPRKRPWFKKASEIDTAALSDTYIFASSKEPGITVSRRFIGAVSGVVGVDLSLLNLSRFAKGQQVVDGGEIMIFDAAGDIYAYSELDELVSSTSSTGKPGVALKIADLQFSAITVLISDFLKLGGNDLYNHKLEVNDISYLSHVESLPKEYGKELFIGMVVPETIFTGPITKTGRQTLFVSLGILILFFPIIYIVAKSVSRPINSLIKNVEDIKAFKLDSAIKVKSNIIEILKLGKAMETMREARKAFGRYIPKPLVEAMIINEITPTLGGDRKNLTFLFTDIQDFTIISESMSPEQLTGSITSYMKKMSRIILENNGTIDKYIGDAIMAFWNAPVDDPDHAHHACLAALQCRNMLTEFNKKRRDNGEAEFLTRMGVYTGEAVVGNIGSSDRMDYTAMGASVNIASRLEGLNKFFGTGILVGETTVQTAGDEFQFRFAGTVTPKGTSVGLGIYELLGTRHGATGLYAPYAVSSQAEGQIREWEAAFELLLSRKFRGASVAFSAYVERYGHDNLVEYYRSRANEYAIRPPDAFWSGEQNFDVK